MFRSLLLAVGRNKKKIRAITIYESFLGRKVKAAINNFNKFL